jgi:formylglycine-generating enzyme required for sulfatase activity
VSEFAGVSSFSDLQQPIVGVNWHDALKFAQWKHMRLPTETEWEYAARGPESVEWPWGNTFSADNLHYEENAEGKTAVVGSYPAGVSWVGAMDLSGNVWEWCITEWREDYTSEENNAVTGANVRRLLRGGSWQNYLRNARPTSRFRRDPGLSNRNIGFRLVCMAPIAE